MKLKALDQQGAGIVNAYGGGGFRISGTRYEGSVIVAYGQVQPWDCARAEDITKAALDAVFGAGKNSEAEKPEILLVGTGPRFMILPLALREWAREQGIMIESMDTGAAARTYNVLRQENRVVAAALIAVE
jgi:uncharacterized protein